MWQAVPGSACCKHPLKTPMKTQKQEPQKLTTLNTGTDSGRLKRKNKKTTHITTRSMGGS